MDNNMPTRRKYINNKAKFKSLGNLGILAAQLAAIFSSTLVVFWLSVYTRTLLENKTMPD